METPRERKPVMLVVRPPLCEGMAEPEHRAAEQLTFEAARVQNPSDIADGDVIDYLYRAGLRIHFDFGEADDVRL